MKVKELAERLGQMDQEAEVYFYRDGEPTLMIDYANQNQVYRKDGGFKFDSTGSETIVTLESDD